MVATNAFGMGINLGNVRVIIHTTISMSMYKKLVEQLEMETTLIV